MAGVTFDRVAKRYGNVSVIEDLSLGIDDQEFMVLVGPSGCGKSTALRMIAGLEEISDGEIRIGERVVNELPPKSRDIAMVFQNYALYPHMTIRENLEFGLRVRKTPPAEISRLVEEAAQILEISNLLDRKPKQLSGGQRQRVALGRAIVRKPAVFLFDEPLSNLDAKLRVLMRAEIKKLQQRLKTTTVYVTHDQIEAMTMGQRIAVMKDGKIQQVGTPLEIYGRPENLFVANFIGTPPMNFLPATIADGGKTLAGKGFSLPVPESLRALTAGADGRKVVIGIRPENILDPSESARGETARLSGNVEVVEPLGDEVIIHVRVGDDVLVYKVEPHAMPEMGDKAELVLELDKLHLFDTVTERRLAA
ncbi:MAG TPA: sn-glycerol-3-phosphate ABC transporter ATP-binding protein UgpC [Thermoanaerobaculia bacterium]|jgi:multiple sugar transport system ATP-binding protein|nr:sn-glycerol-3-phosphate ABC transporter ATP-binding protein UgpC [Thermoanaerobaculia bacterium]